MKNRIAILAIVLLFLICIACNDGGDTNTNTSTVDEACWQRVYNECADGSRSVWTCNDFANETCGD